MNRETKVAERAKADKMDKTDAKERNKDHAAATTNSKSPKKRRKVNHGMPNPTSRFLDGANGWNMLHRKIYS
jgi:hypothetical protein